MKNLYKKIGIAVLSGAVLLGGVHSGMIINKNINAVYAKEVQQKKDDLSSLLQFIEKHQSDYHYGVVAYGHSKYREYKEKLNKVLDINHSVEKLPRKDFSLSKDDFELLFLRSILERGLYVFNIYDLDAQIVIRSYNK